MTPTFDDIEVLARTLWGEARNQGPYGMQAVGEVIANRVADQRWPSTFAGVCQQPKQFSCWLTSDPNYHATDHGDPRRPGVRAGCSGSD